MVHASPTRILDAVISPVKDKTLSDLALEAVAAQVIRRAWQPWDGDEDLDHRIDMAFDARDAFLAALFKQTGITKQLWSSLLDEGVL